MGELKKIVTEHYPVDKLPEELRAERRRTGRTGNRRDRGAGSPTQHAVPTFVRGRRAEALQRSGRDRGKSVGYATNGSVKFVSRIPVYFDANIVIYIVEGHAKFQAAIIFLVDQIESGRIAPLTSALTLAEVLVGLSETETKIARELSKPC